MGDSTREEEASTSGEAAARHYHHGDLRASLIDSALEIVGEKGVGGFTVAEAARRSGVSSGAPFRHFADREELLAAAGTAAVEDLRDAFAAAIDGVEDPGEALAEVSAAFVTYALEYPAKFELTHGPRLEYRESPGMQEARREMLDLIWPLGLALSPDYESALDLIGTELALANGMAALAARGATRYREETPSRIADRARRATRALVRGWR